MIESTSYNINAWPNYFGFFYADQSRTSMSFVPEHSEKTMNIEKLYSEEFAAHISVASETIPHVKAAFLTLCKKSIQALENGNKIMFFGNGGSAADAQHLAAELIVRYRVNRVPIAGIALTTDSSTLTAGANDFGYETIFENQLRAIGKPGDVAVGLSTSGNSENVLRALSAAADMDMTAAALTGGSGGKLVTVADPVLIVPSNVIARIQEMHILIGHMLCDVLEQSAIGNKT